MTRQPLPFNADILDQPRINRVAVEHRCATLTARRSIKGAHQLAWLCRAISCMDLTTLAGDDTPANVKRLCAKAVRPVRAELLQRLGMPDLKVAAVCVYHNLIPEAVDALNGSGLPVAAVSTGFPAGQIPLDMKVAQIEAAVAAGAREIDIVISRAHVLTGDWRALYDEVYAYRKACGEAHLKTILATGELPTLTDVAKASWVCMLAGADFIKTSTGKESVNATLPVGLVMVRAIRAFHEATGDVVGFKPAGGIRTAKDALQWLILIKEELGDDWLHADRFRFGASSLLTDIERQLVHGLDGRYAAAYRQPMS